MHPYLSAAKYLALSAVFSGCAVLPVPEASALKCGETKATTHQIPTQRGNIPVAVTFKMSCDNGQKGIEVSLKGHPWGGVGKTLPMSVGKQAPDYEYIPCDNGKDLKAKWDDLEGIDAFADRGREIVDIQDVYIDMRFRQDYALRYYMLNSAKNMCFGIPQAVTP